MFSHSFKVASATLALVWGGSNLRQRITMNGKHGDHPINDVCDYKTPVFSPRADDLIREIHQYLSRDHMWDLFDWFSTPPIAEFERQLQMKRDELKADAKKRGWELK